MVNRTQALVLGFFLPVWAGLGVILVAAPEVYDQTLKLPHGDRRPAELAFLVALSALIALLGLGVLQRWRWTFWLIVVAFLFGVLRVPTSILALAGALPAAGPTWYELVQALVGLLQCAIALAMLAGYRRAGVWGRSETCPREYAPHRVPYPMEAPAPPPPPPCPAATPCEPA